METAGSVLPQDTTARLGLEEEETSAGPSLTLLKHDCVSPNGKTLALMAPHALYKIEKEYITATTQESHLG